MFLHFGKYPKLPVHALIHDPQKRKLQASTRAHDPFFDEQKIWPSFIFSRFAPVHTFAKVPVHALINKSKKKKLWASTRVHDPFFDNPEIWPTFIYRREVPGHTFAKLPVHALITDLKKFDPKKVSLVKNPHLVMWPTSLSRPKYFGTYPKLPVHALIHDP